MATSYSLLSTVNGRLWDISANKLQASSTIIENNNIAYSSYDGSGVIRPLLKTDTSNNVLQYGYLGRNLMTSTNTGTTIYSTDPTNPSSISITSTGAQLLGVPTAPTATIGTNTTQVATTAFVSNALGSTTTFVPPAVTQLTSGSGTYTTPTNALYLVVEMIGGGGGGGGASTTQNSGGTGGTGGTTTFGSSLLTCVGGSGGAPSTYGGAGGGGTATVGTGATGVAISGGPGNNANFLITGTYVNGGLGGSSPFAGGGYGGQANYYGGAGGANTGTGGGGAGSPSGGWAGCGGGAGGYIKATISTPSSSYSYSVGGAGSGGTQGTGATQNNGGAGGTGVIIVTAYFSAITQTLSTINSTVVAKSDNFNYYPTFINNNTNGSYVIDADGTGALKYNPSTGSLYATKFINNITNYSVYVLPQTTVNGTVTQWVDLQAGGNFTIPNAGVWQVVLQTRLRDTAATSSGYIRLSLCNSGSAGNGEIMNQSGQSRTIMAMEKIQSSQGSFINLGHNAVWLLNVGSAQSFPYAIYPQAFLASITEFVNYNDSNGYPTIQATRIQEPIGTGLFII